MGQKKEQTEKKVGGGVSLHVCVCVRGGGKKSERGYLRVGYDVF